MGAAITAMVPATVFLNPDAPMSSTPPPAALQRVRWVSLAIAVLLIGTACADTTTTSPRSERNPLVALDIDTILPPATLARGLR